MPAVLSGPPQEEMQSIQLIIERLARHEMSEEEAQRQLEEIWERAYHEPWIRMVIRRLLPSLSRYRSLG
jgi:hypothetical protein